MKMKRMLLLMVSMMAANSFAETNEMRGVWTTGPVLSQRGMVVTEKEFKADRNVSTGNLPPSANTRSTTSSLNPCLIARPSRSTPFSCPCTHLGHIGQYVEMVGQE